MIIVCVPTLDPHPNFWPHFTEWYAHNKAPHDLFLDTYYREPLHKAQGKCVQKAKEVYASHILFVEDDHWGFPIDGLDVLLQEDKEIIGLHTFSRRPPYMSIAFKKKDPNLSMIDTEPNLCPIEYVKGQPLVQEMDLIGFGFTLVKVSLFRRLRRDPFAAWTKTATDTHLCQAASEIGIKPFTHYGCTLPHGDITPETRQLYAEIARVEKISKRNRDLASRRWKEPHLSLPARPDLEKARKQYEAIKDEQKEIEAHGEPAQRSVADIGIPDLRELAAAVNQLGPLRIGGPDRGGPQREPAGEGGPGPGSGGQHGHEGAQAAAG